MRELRINLAYKVARHLLAKRQAKSGVRTEARSWDAYAEWRYTALKAQLAETFGLHTALGKDVLDFGCGDGALAVTLMDIGAKSVHGVDVDANGLARFAERLKAHKGPAPTYSLGGYSTINLPDHSFDAIYCFDVLEHVMDYRAIIPEWLRVLRPGGSVYIWWQPYWHPYGHHAEDWLPIPWAHRFLNEDEFREVCARIVDWPGFDAPLWDRRSDGSVRNRFREPHNGGFLNRLTFREFESVCKNAGFTFAQRRFTPFSMPQPARAISSLLSKIPTTRDYFTSVALYELKPVLSASA
jgi:SAM-dependent methyltransferase